MEKVVLRRARRAKNGVAEQLTEPEASQSQPSEPTKPEAVLGFTPPLEKEVASSGSKDEAPLEKGKEKSSDAQLWKRAWMNHNQRKWFYSGGGLA